MADLHLPGRIIIHPTVREADGLALSSRNVYLTMEQRQAAPVLYRALQSRRDSHSSRNTGRSHHPTCDGPHRRPEPLATVEYLAVCHPATL